VADAPAPAPAFEDVATVRARIAARLEGVARSVAVMSGKGGVGKTLVAVNLALALARRGARAALLDADLNSPSVAKMLGLRGQPLRVARGGVRPTPGPLGVAVQGMDFFLQSNQALAWEGPEGEGSRFRSALEEAALADLLSETDWGERDVLVIDLPPGPDRLPALSQLLPALAGAIAVTIPTEVSLLAVERSLRRAQEAGVPVLGLVENLGGSVCAHCGAEGPLFREAPVDARARDLSLEVLARIPFDPALAEAADAGRPLLAEPGLPRSPAVRAFEQLAERVSTWTPPAPEADAW
jgi:ATP-binding protein involved in chromosome partitioning